MSAAAWSVCRASSRARLSPTASGGTAPFRPTRLSTPSFRGRGIGRAMHESRLKDYDWALSSGQSPANARLYRRMGFLSVGQYRQCLAQTSLPPLGLRLRFAREMVSWLRWRARPGHDAGLSVRIDETVPDVPAAPATRTGLRTGRLGRPGHRTTSPGATPGIPISSTGSPWSSAPHRRSASRSLVGTKTDGCSSICMPATPTRWTYCGRWRARSGRSPVSSPVRRWIAFSVPRAG